jgi:hypothetical protein
MHATAPQNQTAYPLSWPNGWPRAKFRHAAPFHSMVHGTPSTGSNYVPRYKRELSIDEATTELLNELRRLGAAAVVISTNVELRQDGLPYSNRRAPDDPGAAVFFTLKGKPVVLACDKWKRVADNIYAIAKHIEALRGQDRWGVGTIEQAFSGYLRLPAPGETSNGTWYSVLGVKHDATFEQAKAAYLEKAKRAHPDMGGTNEAMHTLNAAWDQARQQFGR